MDSFFLKPNVVAEPLINNWYAWPFLIAPHTAAMVLKNKQLKILESYLANPAWHEEAVKQRALAGGPFIRFSLRDTQAIKKMYEDSCHDLQHLLKLAQAIEDLNTLLLTSITKGSSLESLYSKLPEELKGYVELVYDLNNHVNFRFFENLLYESHFNLQKFQSVALSLIENDERDFVINTPRVRSQDKWKIHKPFSNEVYDVLFKAKTSPISKQSIAEIFATYKNSDLDKITELFFTTKSPENNYISTTSQIRIRYFGHACVLLETPTVNIMVDPLISYNYPHEIKRYTYADMPEKIDFLLITHMHQDHVLIEHLLQIRHKVDTVIVPASGGGFLQDPSLKSLFKHLGFSKVISAAEMETINFHTGKIYTIPFMGEHGDLNIQTKSSFCIEINEKKILFAADSNNVCPELYSIIKNIIGKIDIIFLGMECDGAPMSWVYGPLMSNKLERNHDQTRRLNGSDFDRGCSLVDQLDCKQVYIYALAQEPWLKYILALDCDEESNQLVHSNKLVEYCRSKGKVAERLYLKKEIILTNTCEDHL